jgi:hypothetical protein
MTTLTRSKSSKTKKTAAVRAKPKAMPARRGRHPVKAVAKPTRKVMAPIKRVRHAVEIDEERTRVGERASALSVDTGAGVDELGEELGEAWVENVTGADDASNDHRAELADVENAESIFSGD